MRFEMREYGKFVLSERGTFKLDERFKLDEANTPPTVRPVPVADWQDRIDSI